MWYIKGYCCRLYVSMLLLADWWEHSKLRQKMIQTKKKKKLWLSFILCSICFCFLFHSPKISGSKKGVQKVRWDDLCRWEKKTDDKWSTMSGKVLWIILHWSSGHCHTWQWCPNSFSVVKRKIAKKSVGGIQWKTEKNKMQSLSSLGLYLTETSSCSRNVVTLLYFIQSRHHANNKYV